eukprot:8950513-Ditylum_brightwellii.AAC.1
MIAYLLLSVQYQEDAIPKLILSQPPPGVFQWGPTPSIETLCTVIALSIVPIAILGALSKLKNKRSEPNGTNGTVDYSVSDQLTAGKHVWILCLAFGNAMSEEVVSRGFFHYELMESGGLSRCVANFIQASSFGLAHYHILPLGWAGVFLASVYGWMMGELMFYGE